MASTYLYRTNGTPTLGTKYTFSFWMKRSAKDADHRLVNNYVDSNNLGQIYIDATNNKLNIIDKTGGSTHLDVTVSHKFRDPAAFHHIVIAADTTQGTAADRLKVYINGTQQTDFALGATYPSQDAVLKMNAASASDQFRIGSHNGGGDYFDGNLAHFHFVDGTAYAASTFGQTDSTSGIWKPNTVPSVTYGNNGYFLKFENSGAMGTDSSGNTNTFTVSGTMTQNVDTPSNNFCTWNSINPFGGTLANGNLTVGNSSSYDHNVQGTLGMTSGKWYWEYKMGGSHGEFGVCEQGKSPQTDPQNAAGNYFIYNNGSNTTGTVYNNVSGSSSSTVTVTAFANGMICGCAYDADNEALYFHQNGSYVNSGDPTSGASKTGAIITNLRARYNGVIIPFMGFGTSSARTNFHANFGSGFFGTTAVTSGNADANGFGDFEYAVPSGYYALCTKNIKEFG